MNPPYEFRNADGSICCRGTHLCDKCKARLARQRTAAQSADINIDEAEWSAPGPAPNWSDPPTPVPAVRAAAADADVPVDEDDWTAPDPISVYDEMGRKGGQ